MQIIFFFISFGIIETIRITLKIKCRLSRGARECIQSWKLHSCIWRGWIQPSLRFLYFCMFIVSKGNLLDFHLCISTCHAELIKMPRSFLTVSQSEYLIKIVAINLHTERQTVQIRSVGFWRSQLIWICTVCKGRTYSCSEGWGLMIHGSQIFYLIFTFPYVWNITAATAENVPSNVRPANIQISLRICAAWSESSLPHLGWPRMQSFVSRTTKALIRLRWCAGWFEPSLDVHVRRYVSWRCGSNNFVGRTCQKVRFLTLRLK